jgi:hypothetical protein
MLTVGVDLAAEPANTAAARIRWTQTSAQVLSVVVGAEVSQRGRVPADLIAKFQEANALMAAPAPLVAHPDAPNVNG